MVQENPDDLKYKGFAKLYNASGSHIGYVIDMYNGSEHYFYHCKSGNCIAYRSSCTSSGELGSGIHYVVKFKDDMANIYYIGKTEKTITIDL